MTRTRPARRNARATGHGLANPPTRNEIRDANALAYLTREQVAKRLHRSVQTLNNWASIGKGPRFIRHANGTALYPVTDLIAWEESQIKT